MGGRGASTGVSEKGHKYGTDYKTVYQKGNIKFVVKARADAEELLETMTQGRVYVLLNRKENPAYIYYFNKELKTNKRIDISKWHNNMKPHIHYFEDLANQNGKTGASKLQTKEQRMVERVLKIWYNRINK